MESVKEWRHLEMGKRRERQSESNYTHFYNRYPVHEQIVHLIMILLSVFPIPMVGWKQRQPESFAFSSSSSTDDDVKVAGCLFIGFPAARNECIQWSEN